MEFEITVTDLRKLAATVVTDYSRTAGERHLALTFSAASGPCLARMDSEKVRLVLSNLVDNALKYTPAGSVAVELKRAAERDVVVLSIRDTGIGVNPGELPKLFQKFVRASGAGKTATGSGIGLHVAKQLIEGQGGKIRAESGGQGRGTTFFVELPAA